MKENQVQQDLASIRNLMERSSKFISLSGLSGILAGVYALAGSGAAYFMMNNRTGQAENYTEYTLRFSVIAVVVLLASVLTGLLLSSHKAQKTGQQIWGPTSRALLFQMVVPLLTGGLLIILFLSRGNIDMIAAACLIFYGLALISASSYTFTDIKFLGLCDVVLGLIAAIYPDYSLLLWAIGFGALHIVYGSIMYLKYDR